MGQSPGRQAGKKDGSASNGWLASALGHPKEVQSLPQVEPGDEANLHETRQLSSLLRPTDASVLAVLKERYEEEDIYTYGALKSLVVCNPFRPVPCLEDPTALPSYKACLRVDELEGSCSFSNDEPHIWAACREAWAFVRRTGRSVSFVIQGESGAGKTETAKHVMLYFSSPARSSPTSRSGSRRRSSTVSQHTGRLDSAATLGLQGEKAEVHQIMMSANPITEALGNARTLRNDNSSRFGRFVKLFLNAAGEIECSEMSIYSLEKSRVVLQAAGERNFHVFYQLLLGSTEEQRQRHRLRQRAEDYAMLRGGGILQVDGVDDENDWQRLLVAFKAVGADQDMLSGVLDLLSATLLCGEVQWVGESPGDAAVCASPDTFEDLAVLLGVQPQLLEVALSTKKRVMPRGSVVSSPLSPNQAKELTQSIARSLYEALFMWAVGLINTMSRGGKATAPNLPFAGVLDIFGFEAFKLNSLEQLLINYCNERLHQFFIEAAFKREQQMCKEEGINIDLKFQDNSSILTAIDSQDAKSGLGILPLLEEQCNLQSGSNEAFTQSCHRRFGKSPVKCYVEPKLAAREHFEILHSCCPVRYCTSHFREKNMDVMPSEVLQLLLGSSKSFVKEILQGIMPEAAAAPTDKPKKGFIAAQLLRSVSALFTLLRSCEPKFVKCVKTNSSKLPMVMEEELVKSQLHTLSIIESLQIERQGFTYKKLYKEFLDEHTSLCVAVHGCLPSGPSWASQVARKGGNEPEVAKSMVSEILSAVGPPDGKTNATKRPSMLRLSDEVSKQPSQSDPHRKGFAFGMKRIFLTSAMQEWCELMRRRARWAVDEYASSLQATLRAHLAARDACREQGKLVALQARWRRFQAIKLEVQKRRRRRQLRGIWRASTALVSELQRRRRILRLRRQKELLGVFWCSARWLQLLASLRRQFLRRRSRRLLAKVRALGQMLCSFHRAHRARVQSRLVLLKGMFRASGHLVRSLYRIRKARKALHQQQLMGQWRAFAIFRSMLARARFSIKKRRMKGLRGRLRGAVLVLRSYFRSKRRTRAAVEIQRHVRTYLERETLQMMAKLRGQRHAVQCFRRVLARKDAQVALLKLKVVAAKELFKDFIRIWDARCVVGKLRHERNARMIQTITRGLLCRRKFKQLLVRRRANASRELKAYLEAARCRLKFAEFRRCEGFYRAGQLLSETKSLNNLLGQRSRYLLRSASSDGATRRVASLQSIKEASPKASPKVSGATSPSKTPLSPSKLGHSPKKGSSGSSGSPSKTGLPAPLISPRPPAEVVKSLNILQAAANSMNSTYASRSQPRGSPASSESSRREKLPGEVDDGVELTGEMCAPRSKRGDAANAGTANTGTATGRTVVAQNGNSITGFTGGKSRKSLGPSGSGPPGPPSSATSSTNERRRSPRRLSGSSGSGTADRADRADSEGHDIRGSSAAAARTAPAQLRNFLERAHQEANALYTSGALNGFRSPLRGRPNYFAEIVYDPRAEMFSHRSVSPAPRGPQGSFLSPRRQSKDEVFKASETERKASLEVPGSAGNEEHEGPSKAETMQAEHVSPAPTQSNDVKEALGMTPVVEEAEHDEPSAMSPHEALLQSQLQSTQQQLEELQRQYLEVQELLRQKKSHHLAGPSTRSPPPRAGRISETARRHQTSSPSARPSPRTRLEHSRGESRRSPNSRSGQRRSD